MPPKKPEPKKGDQKKAQKVVEDKTFGMKNKKGAQNQKKIQQMQKQVVNKGMSANKVERIQQLAGQTTAESKKDKQKKELEELNTLFKPVIQQQKLEKGVDPKSVLCAFFKQGQCTKGDKCKFSHDPNVGRKAEKRNIYEDTRTDGEGQDTMDAWDEAKLNEVVERKHGEQNRGLPTTTIICKYFLEAVEQNKYGWFWECPNGGIRCHYKHALPSGYVLKRDKKKLAELAKEEELTLEDLIEKERAMLGSGTKITLETFLAWKQRKKTERIQKALDDADRKKEDFKKGKLFGISGRELFEFDPNLVIETTDADDADCIVDSRMRDEDDEYDGENVQDVHTIDLDAMMRAATDVDNTDPDISGTLAPDTRFEEYRMLIAEREATLAAKRLERLKLEAEEAAAAEELRIQSAASTSDRPGTSRDDNDAAGCTPIDEDLFNDDDDDDEQEDDDGDGEGDEDGEENDAEDS